MKAIHEAFLQKYLSTKNEEKQKTMLAQYMLAMSSQELKEFFAEQFAAIRKGILENEWSEAERLAMCEEIDKGIHLAQSMQPVRSAT